MGELVGADFDEEEGVGGTGAEGEAGLDQEPEERETTDAVTFAGGQTEEFFSDTTHGQRGGLRVRNAGRRGSGSDGCGRPGENADAPLRAKW